MRREKWGLRFFRPEAGPRLIPRRYGDRRVEIDTVRLEGADGRERAAYRAGDELYVAMRYRRSDPGLDRAVFGVAFHAEDGRTIFGANTARQGRRVVLEDTGEVVFRVRSLPLVPGRIVVTAAAHDESGHRYDWREYCASFELIAPLGEAGDMFSGEWLTGDEWPLAYTVVIPNYNGAAYLARCLEALRAQTAAPEEVILVDDASTDDGLALVRREFPEVTVIARARNGGFAAAVRQGVGAARTPIVALLNNDAYPRADWAEAALAVFRHGGDIASVASLIVRADDPEIIDSAGDAYTVAGGAVKRGERARLADVKPMAGETFSAVRGGCLLPAPGAAPDRGL